MKLFRGIILGSVAFTLVIFIGNFLFGGWLSEFINRLGIIIGIIYFFVGATQNV